MSFAIALKRSGLKTPPWARLRAAARQCVVGALLLLAAGCAEPATAPLDLEPNTRRAKSTEPSSTEEQLKRTEEAEKARVDQALKSSQATYDQLKAVWQAFLDGGALLGPSKLLVCDPLQYVATVKIVGPEGADIDFGPHKLSIPAGALAARTVITAEAPTSLTVEAKFSPHGTQFAKAPKLQLSYKHCYVPNVFRVHKVVYVSDDFRILEWPVSHDSGDARLVTAQIWHFSRYAVAW